MLTYKQFLLENGQESFGITAPEETKVKVKNYDPVFCIGKDGTIFFVVPKGAQYWVDSEEFLSRDDGPAVLYQKGKSRREIWCKHGYFHRLGDEPALISGSEKQYWIDGLRHRDNGPAVFYRGGGGLSLETDCYNHGIRYVPGKKEKLVEVGDKLAIQRADGTLVFREKNGFYPGSINRDTEKIIRPDGSVEWYEDGRLKEIDVKSGKNYNFIPTRWSSERFEFKWKNKTVTQHYWSWQNVITNFSEEDYTRFFLQLGLEQFLDKFHGYHISDKMKWDILKQDLPKAVPMIKDWTKEQQEYIIEKRPDLIGKIQNLDPELKVRFNHEVELGNVDL